MSWHDELRRVRLADGRELIAASFRGVPFFVQRSERTGGRRTVTHEFPLRDEPYIEDLGRAAATFAVEGYVIGDDYLQQKAALLEALETAGAGELVHPYWGTHQAICDGSLRVSETRRDGGMALFTVVFLRVSSSSAPPPISEPDLAAQTLVAADAAQVATAEELGTTYTVGGEPAFALEGLTAYLEAVAASLLALLKPLASSAQETAELAKQADDLIDAAASLIQTPGDMLDAVVAAIATMQESAAVPARSLVEALLELYSADEPTAPTGTTATRDTERANLTALQAALQRTFAIEAARAIVSADYETHGDATADAGAVADALEEQAAVADDVAYPALVNLRARVLRAVPGNAVLARLVELDRPTALPSLLLSYQLYGSLDGDADIVARNRVRHPAFLAGSLQVLSDV